jgi:predicted HicB family RNase H-like nuclease
MVKKSWAKGRKDPTCLVRVEPDIYNEAKEEAEKEKMTLKAWISMVIRNALNLKKREK